MTVKCKQMMWELNYILWWKWYKTNHIQVWKCYIKRWKVKKQYIQNFEYKLNCIQSWKCCIKGWSQIYTNIMHMFKSEILNVHTYLSLKLLYEKANVWYIELETDLLYKKEKRIWNLVLKSEEEQQIYEKYVIQYKRGIFKTEVTPIINIERNEEKSEIAMYFIQKRANKRGPTNLPQQQPWHQHQQRRRVRNIVFSNI